MQDTWPDEVHHDEALSVKPLVEAENRTLRFLKISPVSLHVINSMRSKINLGPYAELSIAQLTQLPNHRSSESGKD